MDIKKYTDENLHKYAQRIADETSQKVDEHSLGKVQCSMALRRSWDGNANDQDIGLMDAINDTLQDLGMAESQKTFYKL